MRWAWRFNIVYLVHQADKEVPSYKWGVINLTAFQLFWEKRLEGLRACDPDGYEFDGMDLPKTLKPVGPYVTEETLLQSVATALHVSSQPVTGQTGSKTALEKNPGVFLNPEQPLVQVFRKRFTEKFCFV